MTESFEPAGFGDEPAATAHHVPHAPAPGDRLAALLQSAVDDQVAEQRQLSRLMADVRAALVDRGAGGDVAHAVARLESGLRDGLARTDQHIADLTDRLAQAQQAVANVRERLDAPTGGSDDAATLQEVHDGLAGLRTELRVVPESVAPAVAQAVGAGLTDVGRTLERLEAAQQSMRQDLVTVQSELAEFWPQVSAYGARLDALPQVAAALTALTDRSKALDEVPAAVSALRAEVETIRVSQQALAAAPTPAGLAGAEIANIVREGVRDATRDFVRDYLREAVQDIVTMSTRDTERRITDHVDEAVLALAQALLRRRPTLDMTATTVPSPEQGAPGEPSWTASRDGEQPADEHPADEEPADEEPADEHPAGREHDPAEPDDGTEPAAQRVAEQQAAEQQVAEQQAAEQQVAEQPPAQPVAEQPPAQAPQPRRSRRGWFRR